MGVGVSSPAFQRAKYILYSRCKESIEVAAKNSVRPSKDTAEGGCGGNSAVSLQKIEASPAVLLVQSRTPKKSFVFLLGEKIRRAQIRNRKQNFSLGWRVPASGGGAASLVSFKVDSRKVYNYSTSKEKSKSFGSPRFARRLICIQFWGQKRIGGFAFWGKLARGFRLKSPNHTPNQ